MKLRLGTRASLLAVTQSELVAAQLRALGHTVELVRIRTGGDVERGSLTRLGTLGVFAAELRSAILDGRCDFAVHSLKDLPVTPVPGLIVAAVPERVCPYDALCAAGRRFDELPAGAKVGTGSPRRVAQLRAKRPDLRFVDIRGNVGTRLARVADGDLDAVVLAAAGLRRLGMAEQIDELLPILPAPGQGALALECRADNADVLAALGVVEDPAARTAVEAERAVLAGLGGGCAAPIGALVTDGVLRTGVFALDGGSSVVVERPLTDGAADDAVRALLDGGAAEVAELDATRPSRLAELHDEASLWRGETPLAGVQVLLPRADGALADGLRATGAEVLCQPVQEAVALPFDEPLPEADWVAVTSANTVRTLTARGTRLPQGARIAAVGAATARALEAHGYTVDLVPEGESSGRALAAAFPDGPGRVLIPGSKLSSPTLADGLRAKGWDVTTVAMYTMAPVAEISDEARSAWDSGQFDVVVITSGSAGRAFGTLFGWRDDVRVVAFGAPSGRWLRDHKIPVAATATTQDATGIVGAIAEALPKAR